MGPNAMNSLPPIEVEFDTETGVWIEEDRLLGGVRPYRAGNEESVVPTSHDPYWKEQI